MPIRKEMKARYPKDWKEISLKIRKRSRGQCECRGECGLHRTNPGPRRCEETNGQPAVWAKGKIVLTVAHLDHKPENCNPANLRAMCQRCHLRYDRFEHAKNSKITREKKKGRMLPGFE